MLKNKKNGRMCKIVQEALVKVKYEDTGSHEYVEKSNLVEHTDTDTIMKEGTKFQIQQYSDVLTTLTVKTVGHENYIPLLRTFDEGSNNRYSDFNCYGKTINDLISHVRAKFIRLISE
jgi:hypothetical protein